MKYPGSNMKGLTKKQRMAKLVALCKWHRQATPQERMVVFVAKMKKDIKKRKASRARVLSTMPYDAYLSSPEWDAKRKARLKYAGHRCQLCNRKDIALHVHHRTYERIGHEDEADLTVLCANCHKKFHGK